jgi:hypothetical protein
MMFACYDKQGNKLLMEEVDSNYPVLEPDKKRLHKSCQTMTRCLGYLCVSLHFFCHTMKNPAVATGFWEMDAQL